MTSVERSGGIRAVEEAGATARRGPGAVLAAARKRPLAAAGAALAILALALVPILMGGGQRSASAVELATVERRDIALTIDATGTVEPIDLVEVKSKASGQIVRMPVQVGSRVRAGELLAQIDTRDVRNQYDQTLAARRAAGARLAVASAQKKRSDELFRQQVITAAEHEAATLGYASAQAEVVRARTDLDLARQRLEDATVRAPVAGTVLEQSVATGQVISSATSSASGGTTLLTMADLSRIRLRALVNESDIGNVRPGLPATVTVDAFPQRPFQGTVEKIEPQAVVQQSVTLFPVLISISNDDGLLLPGMNGEVSMLVERRGEVLAVPLDAVRSVREVSAAAAALGLDPAAVRSETQKQMEASRGGRVGSDSLQVARAGRDSIRARRRAGGGRSAGREAGRDVARGGAWAPTPGTGGARGGRGARSQVVFVKTRDGLAPRVVRIGLSDFDYAEVVSGLEEGEQVALLSVVEARAQRSENQSRIRERMSGGTPGIPGGGGRGGGGGGGGGRGGR